MQMYAGVQCHKMVLILLFGFVLVFNELRNLKELHKLVNG